MTLVAGLRAASYGIPFQPVAGVHGSDLAGINGWKKIADPYGGETEVYVIPALSPDITVIHANAVDEKGNARVLGYYANSLLVFETPEGSTGVDSADSMPRAEVILRRDFEFHERIDF